jgi:hypothetical protein
MVTCSKVEIVSQMFRIISFAEVHRNLFFITVNNS